MPASRARIENTWRFGLERMLLGYAMDERDGMFEGVLPFGGMQVEAGRLAGVLADIHRAAGAVQTDCCPPSAPLRTGAPFCRMCCSAFLNLSPKMSMSGVACSSCVIRPALIQKHADFDRPVAFEMLLEALENELERSRHPAGFFSGAVTFAEMQPMRAYPVQGRVPGRHERPRVSTPGVSARVSPDAAVSRRPGDRDPGKDDRYVFLEALLAARDAFFISYTGQSQQDNASLPPSVLVSELLDALEQSSRVEGIGLMRAYFLQAFPAAL